MPNLTSSRTGATLYFAYGSNLSPTQMSLRLPHSPTTSATPLAIARLDNFQWIICQRGYANVVKLLPGPPPSSPPSSLDSTVYGILYNLHPADEAALDRYEGHTPDRNPTPEPNFIDNTSNSVDIERPFHQGNWDYNKHYLPVRIIKWLIDDDEHIHVAASGEPEGERVVRALVYVDEYRTQHGQINAEYVGRMNRAIAESTALGLPRDWVDAVIRRDVVPGVELADRNYVGRIE